MCRNKRSLLFFLAVTLLAGAPWPVRAAAERRVVFLVSAADSAPAARSFRNFELPPGIRFEYLVQGSDAGERIRAAVRAADVVIANTLVEDYRKLLETEVDYTRTAVYVFSRTRLPERLPVREPPEIKAYRAYRCPENFRNLVRFVIHRELDDQVKFAPPVTLPATGIVHPDFEEVFENFDAYAARYREGGRFQPGRPYVAVTVYAASVTDEELRSLRRLTDALEKAGLNAFIAFGDEVGIIRKHLLAPDGTSRVAAVVGLSFKFKSALKPELAAALADLGVPVYNALRLYRQTTAEYLASPQGMNTFSVAFALIAPEISGLIEPTLLFGRRAATDPESGREYFEDEPFAANIDRLAARIAAQAALQSKPNAEKKVAIFIYNGSGGKQSTGASYLNVPRSLANILAALRRAGYRAGDPIDEAGITGRITASAHNVGSWAPGELDELIANGAIRLPVAEYKNYFAALPETLQKAVVAQWGEVENASIMIKNGEIIIPAFVSGNVVILPEPMRGWLDDPEKIAHSATIQPHHQYLAVYLWLKHGFGADAMIHLGRHATFEWLPGKQLGLDENSPSALLISDIPSIYPYIVDGVGEGLQAKRRGAAVIIDHLTPPLAGAGLPPETRELAARIDDFESAPAATRDAKLADIRVLAGKTGLAAELGIEIFDDHAVSKLHHHLEAQAAAVVPFGLHSFGAPPPAEAIEPMLTAIAAGNPAADPARLRTQLLNAGSDELTALLAALDGKRIAPGESGDPVRNPDSLPVGRNFYSFDPDRLPTDRAYEEGAKAAAELLEKHRREHGGNYPAKVGIVLWAGETVRNEGVNESIVLALLGMTPVRDRNGRVTGVVPIPGARLGRPRIDVMVTASGAYRDQFAALLTMLDRAQRTAAQLADAENFIRQNSEKAAAKLTAAGVAPAEAAELAARRIFCPAPGTYGVGVAKIAGASGLWQEDDQVLETYLRRMSHAVDASGEVVPSVRGFEAGLGAVEAVMHSRSSNVYGVSDINDMFQYLGGLSMAVRKHSGNAPETYIIDQRVRGKIQWTPLRTFLGDELRARVFHPEWIKAMRQENYAGAKTLAGYADNLWGWQVVTPENVSEAVWKRLYDVYVEDVYDLGMKEFLEKDNAWAKQSITARLLEAVRKNYWNASPDIRQKLAVEYAVSVAASGVACCDHTCNNPLLHDMVTNLISIPGVLAPDLVMKFKAAIEKAAGKTLADQVAERRELQRQLEKAFARTNRPEPAETAATAAQPTPEKAREAGPGAPVKGYKLVDKTQADDRTELTSAGIRYLAVALVIALIALFAFGFRRGDD